MKNNNKISGIKIAQKDLCGDFSDSSLFCTMLDPCDFWLQSTKMSSTLSPALGKGELSECSRDSFACRLALFFTFNCQ